MTPAQALLLATLVGQAMDMAYKVYAKQKDNITPEQLDTLIGNAEQRKALLLAEFEGL
jgi:hypothetical protein